MRLNNILYVHIPRTGGTYFEKKLGFKGHNTKPPCGNRAYGANYDEIMGWDSKTRLMLQHASYEQLVEFKFIEADNDLLKVSIVRNPYYRTVSLYRYFGGPKKWKSFDAFLTFLEKMNGKNYFYQPQFTFLMYDDQVVIDNIIKFENYAEDIERFSQEHDLNLLNLKVTFDKEKHIKKDKSIDSEFYSNEDNLRRVGNIYKRDFKLFGYDIDR
mgnify:CR=1 FL=1